MKKQSEFGSLLRAHREKGGYSVRSVAAHIDPKQSENGLVNKWEHGTRKPPSVDTCRRIAEFLEIDDIAQFLDAAVRERGKPEDVVAYYESKLQELVKPTSDEERNATRLYRALPRVFRDATATQGLRSLLITAANPPSFQEGTSDDFIAALRDFKELPKVVRWSVLESFCASVKVAKTSYNMKNNMGKVQTGE